MANLHVSEWRKLPVSLAELCIDTTLRCGQSFRWRKLRDAEWSCALHGRIISLKQDSTHIHYRTSRPHATDLSGLSASVKSEANIRPEVEVDSSGLLSQDDDAENLLRHYFNLSPDLTALYERWSSVDANFKKRAPKFTGVRILKQDAWEALVSFICSSNNNIIRISQMVHNLCLNYGPLIGHIDGQPFHDFPAPNALIGPRVEAHLRELGFGYRAGYIAKTALLVAKERPEGWLQSLYNVEPYDDNPDQKPLPEGGRPGYRTAHEELLQLLGVGPKVADCVCLMGLAWGEAVPVDTHVWQIAQRDYKFGKGKNKSLTRATYDAVGDHFRQLWGKEAGWAHSVLFAADLKTSSERLTTKVEVDVDEVKIKHENRTIEESKMIVKREYAPHEVLTKMIKNEVKHEVKDEFPDENSLVDNFKVESTRDQRAKRRRIG